MIRATILIWFLIFSFAFSGANGQEAAEQKNSHRWAMYAGIGPNYYINNLQVGKDLVKELNYNFVARLMWEPEYFLSLGFETGYNRLYSLSGNGPQAGNINIVNAAIPIQVVISMKFLKHYYCNFNLGQAFLINNVSTGNQGSNDASVLSLGDFGATIGYRRDISERFMLGGELKGYYSGKLEDKNISLVFMAGYRLW
jgi:hypothetical protein